MEVSKIMELVEKTIPPRSISLAEFKGTLPGSCDAKYSQLWAAFRSLTPDQRCEVEKLLTVEQRSWLRSEAHRMAMLSVRQQSRAHLEDTLLGIYLGYPDANAEPLDWRGYAGGLAICFRCAHLLGLGPEVFESQLQYVCQEGVHESVHGFLAAPPEKQQLQYWDFREETGDHGIIFRWGQLSIPEAWL
ncbi:MAG: hypothetical protein CVU38_19815 [Chloroflexi bacterium HGW-Chloroflexi-1]|nr:MAG: hypothetical protein CVU38_19815 [Chloroflexi bacterium HGW-Chloroflexi-1]